MNKFLAICAACLGFAASVSAFSLLGPNRTPTQPNTPWQTRVNGYGDAGGPMFITEEYRWNTPYLTYAFDPSFQAYGVSGSNAVEQAIAIFNALPPSSQINLDDFPLEAQRFNFVAQSLQLRDVKSHTMSLLLDELGLTSPENYVWTLRSHDHPGGRPNAVYTVIQRNYDPYTLDPTAYINGSLYTYADIFDSDSPHVAFPIVIPVDPFNEFNFSSVAGFNLLPGGYFTSLTRDDVGGLRYLFATNNYNVENLIFDAEVIRTNPIPTELTTGDLAQLYKDTHDTTNTPGDVLTNYPGLNLTSTNAYIGYEFTTNIFTYFTNYPAAPIQVFVTNIVSNVVTRFNYTYDNVVTRFTFTNELGELVTLDAIYGSRPNLVQAYEVVPALDYQPGQPNIRTNYIGTNTIDFADYFNDASFIASFGGLYTNAIPGAFYPAIESIGVGPDGLLYPYLATEMVTNGEYYIVPANLLLYPSTNVISGSNVFGSFSFSNVLGYSFLSNVLTTTILTTNLDFFASALLTIRTNFDDPQAIGWTTNLYTFSEQARTNSPADMQALYTNLLILKSTPVLTNQVSSNLVFYFTNSPFDPGIGSFGIASNVNYTTNLVTNWVHVFGNVVTNLVPNSLVVTQEQAIVFEPYQPAGGLPTTNFTIISSNFNNLDGTIFIVPTNLFGYDILPNTWCDSPQVVRMTNQFVFTNFSLFGTNFAQSNVIEVIRYATNYCLIGYPIEFVNTNDLASNVFGFRREVITFSTNHTFAVQEIELVPATNFPPQLRPGVDKVNFVRTGYDSIVGQQFLPVTNYYLDTYVISNEFFHQVVRRASRSPDILFSAADINLPGDVEGSSLLTTPDHWENNYTLNRAPGAAVDPAGPGVIDPPIRFAFTTTAPFYYNFIAGALTNGFFFLNQPALGQILDGRFAAQTFAWASFDGTTNYPVIYPQGQSITNLLNQVLDP